MGAMEGNRTYLLTKSLLIYYSTAIIEIEWCQLRNIYPVFMQKKKNVKKKNSEESITIWLYA